LNSNCSHNFTAFFFKLGFCKHIFMLRVFWLWAANFHLVNFELFFWWRMEISHYSQRSSSEVVYDMTNHSTTLIYAINLMKISALRLFFPSSIYKEKIGRQGSNCPTVLTIQMEIYYQIKRNSKKKFHSHTPNSRS